MDDYQEKLRLAKKALDSGSYDKETIEYIFPELKESEDEEIRKHLISFLKDVMDFGKDVDFNKYYKSDCAGWIAWLEKQGEKTNPYSGISFEYNSHTWGMCARDNGVDILLDKQLFKHLENQGERKQNVIDIISDLENYFATTTKEQQEKDWEEIKKWEEKHFNHNKHIEQKPTEKVKPKFKIGDWVIDKQGIIRQIANVIENVTNHTYGYDVVGGEYFNDNTEGVKLWTIQDAKDGDVLCAKGNYFKEYIFNFSSLTEDDVISTHFGYDVFRGTFDTKVSRFGREEEFMSLTPATKEQHDTLFAKMKEVGYEWDVEKKELKKIEQKPDWSEEDEQQMKSCFDFLDNISCGDDSELNDCRNWLKSLKERMKGE